MSIARVNAKGARRWLGGHPWIYRTDVIERPMMDAGAVLVHDNRGKPIGWALWSPLSEISLRLLDSDPDAVIDQGWWDERIASAIAVALAIGTMAPFTPSWMLSGTAPTAVAITGSPEARPSGTTRPQPS